MKRRERNRRECHCEFDQRLIQYELELKLNVRKHVSDQKLNTTIGKEPNRLVDHVWNPGVFKDKLPLGKLDVPLKRARLASNN